MDKNDNKLDIVLDNGHEIFRQHHAQPNQSDERSSLFGKNSMGSKADKEEKELDKSKKYERKSV